VSAENKPFTIEDKSEIVKLSIRLLFAMVHMGIKRTRNTSVALRLLSRAAFDDDPFGSIKQLDKQLDKELDFLITEMERQS
jgi:hypothetical protein